jgi:hypothetical protein
MERCYRATSLVSFTFSSCGIIRIFKYGGLNRASFEAPIFHMVGTPNRFSLPPEVGVSGGSFQLLIWKL